MPKQSIVRIPVVHLTKKDFLSHPHARRYVDVVNDTRLDFDEWLKFFSDPLRQLRLFDAERHYDRPALAGVVRELENHPTFNLLITHKRDDTRRHRQAIGVIVKLIMEKHGWKTTGRKGFMGGGRAGGISKVFGKSERYVI